MSRWGEVLALALVLASQVALAQKADKPRVVVLDFEGDRRDALRNQVEAGLKKGKQVELVPLKKYMSAAAKLNLKGAAVRIPEGVMQVAPGLNLDAVVTATVGKALAVKVLAPDGHELWTKNVKLTRGKMSASDARKLVAGLATTAAKPPPAVPTPAEQPAPPATPEATPPATPPTATPPPPAPETAKPPPAEAPVAETKPPATPPATKPPSSETPVASAPEKSGSESLETPKSLDEESHTSTKPFDEYATREELEAQDRHRHPPIIQLFLGGTTTWRQYCARPGAASCAEFDARPEEGRVGDTIDFKSGVPYLGLMGQLELQPLARTGKPWRGLGLLASYQQGYSETRVKVTTDTGETPTRSVLATDSVITGMLMYRYFFNLGTEASPRFAYVGVRGGMLSRAFEVDADAAAPLTGSHRLYPAAGLEFSVPLKSWLKVEGAGQYFIGPQPGKSLTADKGELELEEVLQFGTDVSSAGWFAELGLAGDIWGPLGYSVRGRYTTVKDTFTGAGARPGWGSGGVAEEQHIDIRWGLTASY